MEGRAENKQGGNGKMENHGKFWGTHPESTSEKKPNQPANNKGDVAVFYGMGSY